MGRGDENGKKKKSIALFIERFPLLSVASAAGASRRHVDCLSARERAHESLRRVLDRNEVNFNAPHGTVALVLILGSRLRVRIVSESVHFLNLR